MLDRIHAREPKPITRTDKVAILRVLADMLPFDGIIVDELGHSYFSDNSQCPYERRQHADYLQADIQPLRANTALVKLHYLNHTKHTGKHVANTSLFLLAKSDDEWEMMGQPLPFVQLRIPA